MEAPGWSPNADFIVYVIKVSTETRMELMSKTELLPIEFVGSTG